MRPETVIYGRKENEPEYMEQLLFCGKLLTDKQIETVKKAATKDGFKHFRVWTFDGEKPDFIGALNV